jgi:hypothetical protein
MSGYDNEYDDDFDQNDGPKALREALKAEKAARKEAEKKLAELSQRDRQRTVADVLKSQGVKPALARFVLADLEEVDEKSVSKWVEENADLFGIELGNAPDPAPANGVSDQEAAEAARQASLQGGGAVASVEEQLANAIQNAKSAEELTAVLAQAQAR